MADKLRLDKMLANLGYGSRNDIKKASKAGLIYVNETQIKDVSMKINPEVDVVVFDGEVVQYRENIYLMLNKPAGYISATVGRDPTVMDLIDLNIKDLAPCGRLDKDTVGLLLITNDGPLVHQLLSPKYEVEKEYYVELRDLLTEDMVKLIQQGIQYDQDTYFRPAIVRNINEKNCTIIVTEGQFHEVKRIFEAVGNEVTYLKRIRMKNLLLDESLVEGDYRELTDEELADLKEWGQNS